MDENPLRFPEKSNENHEKILYEMRKEGKKNINIEGYEKIKDFIPKEITNIKYMMRLSKDKKGQMIYGSSDRITNFPNNEQKKNMEEKIKNRSETFLLTTDLGDMMLCPDDTGIRINKILEKNNVKTVKELRNKLRNKNVDKLPPSLRALYNIIIFPDDENCDFCACPFHAQNPKNKFCLLCNFPLHTKSIVCILFQEETGQELLLECWSETRKSFCRHECFPLFCLVCNIVHLKSIDINNKCWEEIFGGGNPESECIMHTEYNCNGLSCITLYLYVVATILILMMEGQIKLINDRIVFKHIQQIPLDIGGFFEMKFRKNHFINNMENNISKLFHISKDYGQENNVNGLLEEPLSVKNLSNGNRGEWETYSKNRALYLKKAGYPSRLLDKKYEELKPSWLEATKEYVEDLNDSINKFDQISINETRIERRDDMTIPMTENPIRKRDHSTPMEKTEKFNTEKFTKYREKPRSEDDYVERSDSPALPILGDLPYREKNKSPTQSYNSENDELLQTLRDYHRDLNTPKDRTIIIDGKKYEIEEIHTINEIFKSLNTNIKEENKKLKNMKEGIIDASGYRANNNSIDSRDENSQVETLVKENSDLFITCQPENNNYTICNNIENPETPKRNDREINRKTILGNESKNGARKKDSFGKPNGGFGIEKDKSDLLENLRRNNPRHKERKLNQQDILNPFEAINIAGNDQYVNNEDTKPQTNLEYNEGNINNIVMNYNRERNTEESLKPSFRSATRSKNRFSDYTHGYKEIKIFMDHYMQDQIRDFQIPDYIDRKMSIEIDRSIGNYRNARILINELTTFTNLCMEDVDNCLNKKCYHLDIRKIELLKEKCIELLREESRRNSGEHTQNDYSHSHSRSHGHNYSQDYQQNSKDDHDQGPNREEYHQRASEGQDDFQRRNQRRYNDEPNNSMRQNQSFNNKTFSINDSTNNSRRHNSFLNTSTFGDYIPPGESLISKFPLNFAEKDISVKNDHYNRLELLNIDKIPTSIQKSFQMYRFLENVTSFKNMMVEFSQRNLVGLMLDRLKGSSVTSQINEMYEEMYAEGTHIERYHCFYTYKHLEMTYCKPLLNLDSVTELIDQESNVGSTLAYIQRIKPFCEIWAKNILRMQDPSGAFCMDMKIVTKMKENLLRDKLIRVLPKHSLATLQGLYGPGLKTVNIGGILSKLQELEYIADMRKPTKIHEVKSVRSQIDDSDDDENEINRSEEVSNDSWTENVYTIERIYRKGGFNPRELEQKANVQRSHCFKCGDDHLFVDKRCPYVDKEMTKFACKKCNIGLHDEAICIKLKKKVANIEKTRNMQFKQNRSTNTKDERKVGFYNVKNKKVNAMSKTEERNTDEESSDEDTSEICNERIEGNIAVIEEINKCYE